MTLIGIERLRALSANCNRLVIRQAAFLILLLASLTIFSQDVQINNIVATDIVASKDDIIEIRFNDQLANLPFLLAWIDEGGKQYALQLATGTDDLILPIGIQEGWKGNIGLIGLSLDNVDVTIRKSNVGDLWRGFMTKFPLSPGSINFNGTYLFYGRPFRLICLGLMVFFFLVLFAAKRKFALSFLLAFAIAWGIYDLRSIKNRWDIMTELGADQYQISIFKELDVFLPKARDIIGEQSWSKDNLSGVLNSYCTYQLADLKYYPPRTELKKDADFIITHNPNNREVVLQQGTYYLVKSANSQ